MWCCDDDVGDEGILLKAGSGFVFFSFLRLSFSFQFDLVENLFSSLDFIASSDNTMPQYLPTRPPPSVLIPWTLIAAYVIHRLATNIYNISVGANTDFRVHPSPLTTLLPELSSEKTEHLPYPPDAYPGARDVVSPYGSLRVYEWGPEDGRKVFLVHGIANPCIALGEFEKGGFGDDD